MLSTCSQVEGRTSRLEAIQRVGYMYIWYMYPRDEWVTFETSCSLVEWQVQVSTEEAKKEKACRHLCDSPTTENFNSFKKIKSQGRRMCLRAKSDRWCKCISSINCFANKTKVGNRVNKFKGRQTIPLPVVVSQGDTAKYQAGTLGANFEYISRSAQYSETFLRCLRREHRINHTIIHSTLRSFRLHWTAPQFRSRNQPNTLDDMIKHLCPETPRTLLLLLNYILQWPQPCCLKRGNNSHYSLRGKDPTSVNSYRIIALRSYPCIISKND